MNLVLSYRRKAWLTFLLMSSRKFNEEGLPCVDTNDWARRGIPVEDRLVFQRAGFDERSGFEIPLVPNQCSRMVILVVLGSLSRTMHPDNHCWSMQASGCYNPGSSLTSLQIFIIPPRIHDPSGYHRNQEKVRQPEGQPARPNHVRHRCMDGVLTCLCPYTFRKRSTCCGLEVKIASHWPV
jgi:hypothetical protein